MPEAHLVSGLGDVFAPLGDFERFTELQKQ